MLPDRHQDLIDTLADRPYDPAERRENRARAAARLLEAIAPRDAVEEFLAGQVAAFEAMALDALQAAASTDDENWAHKHRTQAGALSRLAFSMLKEINRRRADQAKAAEAEPEPEVQPRPQAAQPAPKPVPPLPRPHTAPSGFRADSPRPQPPVARAMVAALAGT